MEENASLVYRGYAVSFTTSEGKVEFSKGWRAGLGGKGGRGGGVAEGLAAHVVLGLGDGSGGRVYM